MNDSEARGACEEAGAYLVKLNTEREASILRQYILQHFNCSPPQLRVDMYYTEGNVRFIIYCCNTA